MWPVRKHRMRDERRVGTVVRALVFGLAGLGSRWFVAPSMAADALPAPWVHYAQRVAQAFQASLAGTDPRAVRFHTFLESAALNAQDRPPPTEVIVKAWIDAEGRITRVEFDSLGTAQADEDLRVLLIRPEIGEMPPPDMRQPLRVRLRLIVTT